MMIYQIGQILFVVLAKKNQVYPMRIVEVITKKSLKGEEVKYLLQAGSDPTATLMLDQIDGEVFKSAEEAKTILTKRATSQVAKLVNVAVTKSKEWYGTGLPTKEVFDDEINEVPSKSQEEGVSSVMLPDGTVATVKLPTTI
jgi:hypothetical protein